MMDMKLKKYKSDLSILFPLIKGLKESRAKILPKDKIKKYLERI
jgi:hypothetical protein